MTDTNLTSLNVSGTSTLTGAVSAPAGVTGNLTGNVTGDITANTIAVNSAPGITIGGYNVATYSSYGDGMHVVQCAMATFDMATEANRTIAAHDLGVTLPIYSTVLGGYFEVNTAFTSENANNGTIAISVEGANDIQTAAAVSGAPYSTIGRKAITPKFNTPESTSVKCTAARAITATVAVSAMLTGKLTVYLFFVVGKAAA